jgi:hypothetical protein
MEDRLTDGLYLEMTDRDPESYRRVRVPEVMEISGAERASCWENCVPHRTDLPRRLPEFHLLGVYEVTLDFTAPALPEDVRGHYFRRYPRPAQGTINGKPTLGLELVLVSPKSEDQAQAFRDWADFVHIHDIAAAAPPSFTMITPYENVTRGEPRYLHFYELDTDEPEPAFQEMTPAVQRRIGAPGTHPFKEWAMHPALVIEYVNTFRRLRG